MDYYSQKFYLPLVDKNDNIIGKKERWEIHKKGQLHRGFTTILIYKNRFVIQHRKHPAFDDLFDFTFSSHPVYIDEKLQTMEEAIVQTLTREWNITKNDLKSKINFLDKIYYRAVDPRSNFIEHEVDYIYFVEINRLPQPNPDFAYGYKLISTQQFLKLKTKNLELNLAPWVNNILHSKTILPRLGF